MSEDLKNDQVLLLIVRGQGDIRLASGAGAHGKVRAMLDDALQSIDVLDCICRLGDKSLLILEQSEGSPRYRMLETIRAYAFERLRESDEVAPMQMRFYLPPPSKN